MNSPAFVIGIKCKFCRKFYGASRITRGNENEGRICDLCFEAQENAFKVLTTQTIPSNGVACMECHITFQQLARLQPGPQARMFIAMKDGVYQMLCPSCNMHYSERCGQFEETLWGRKNKIRGYR